MTNFVDGVAMTLPWAGGLVPATLTYQNLALSGLEPWQAGVVAAVVEGMGFVAVTTVIDIYEHNRGTGARAQVSGWAVEPMPETGMSGMFWIALGGAAMYLLAVLVINVLLDPAASGAKMATGGLLSTFGVLGGMMVALRNQLNKKRDAQQTQQVVDEARIARRDADAKEERELQLQIQLDRERAERELAQALELEKMHLEQELALQKVQADSAVKMEKVRAVQAQSAAVVPAVQAQSEVVRKMVRCSEPGCGMEYAAVGGKGGHYKKWHLPAANGSADLENSGKESV